MRKEKEMPRQKRSFLIKSDLWGDSIGCNKRKQFSKLTSTFFHYFSSILLLLFQIQFSLKITCCWDFHFSFFLFLSSFSTHHKFQFSPQFTFETGNWTKKNERKEEKNVCRNKFSIKLFSFLLPPALCPILLNGYVADLIQIFFFFALFSYPFRKLFSPFHRHSEREREKMWISSHFPRVFQWKSLGTVSCKWNKSLLFIVVCALDQSRPLFSSSIETLSHVIWKQSH